VWLLCRLAFDIECGEERREKNEKMEMFV